MATIEPRLMHLLNVNDSKDHLPSIHSTLGAAADGDALLLPPLELNATEKHLQPATLGSSAAAFLPALGDDPSAATAWPARADFSTLPGSPDDALAAGAASASITGKRLRVLPHTDELIQLPQPLKKQKSIQQVGPLSQVFPPIINGLHEPPPNAAVFPPIASEFDTKDTLGRAVGAAGAVGGSFAYDGLLMGTPAVATDTLAAGHTLPAPAAPSLAPPVAEAPAAPLTAKPKRRAAKPRRRWTEEETNQLLIGVSRHGLGKWTAILEDPEFSFCSRSAGDLKDRFRTCCPDELRGKLTTPDKVALPSTFTPAETFTKARPQTKTSLSLEDILIEPDDQQDDQPPHPDAAAADAAEPPRLRKRRVHRRNMEDMFKLGIQGPFKKSHRRERRPFTEQDDREILEGLQLYGPAWTKIHRHPSFNLSSRQPTDLRDRVRNKYPETYASIEKSGFQLQPHDGPVGTGQAENPGEVSMPANNTLLEPSVYTTMEKPPARTSLPSLSRIEPLEPHDSSSLDMGESATSAFLGNVGEMGISRLLLDDPQIPSYPL